MTDDRWVEARAAMASSVKYFRLAQQYYVRAHSLGHEEDLDVIGMAFMHAMHAGHTSLEEGLLKIMDAIGEARPDGATWRVEVLRRMRAPSQGKRPAFLSSDMFAHADETRRFRNFAARAYDDFNWEAAERPAGAATVIAQSIMEVFAAFQCALEGSHELPYLRFSRFPRGATKMKMRVLSDLHVEFGGVEIADDVDCDVVVLAGDIDVLACRNPAKWARETFANREIVWVLGNHEFYGGEMFQTLKHASDGAKRYGVHLLEKRSLELAGVRFLGCTLWTDFALQGDIPMGIRMASAMMNDFRIITISHEHDVLSLRPEDTAVMHNGSVGWLDRTLAEPFDGKTVVVTHHAPHARCNHPAYTRSPLSPAYCSDLGWMIDKHAPDVWISGHTHSSHQFQIGRTLMVANQRGYSNIPEEGAGPFDPRLVITL